MPRSRTWTIALTLLSMVTSAVSLEVAQVRRLYGREVYTILDKTLDDQYFVDLDNQVRAYFPGIDSLKIQYVVAATLKSITGTAGTIAVTSNFQTQRKATLGDDATDTMIVYGGRAAFGRSDIASNWAPGSVAYVPETTIDIGKYGAITEDTTGILNIGNNYRVGLIAGPSYQYRSRRAGGWGLINMNSDGSGGSVQLRAGVTTADTGAFTDRAKLVIDGASTYAAATFTSARTTSVAQRHPSVMDLVHSGRDGSPAAADTNYTTARALTNSALVYRLTADGATWQSAAYVGDWQHHKNYSYFDASGALTMVSSDSSIAGQTMDSYGTYRQSVNYGAGTTRHKDGIAFKVEYYRSDNPLSFRMYHFGKGAAGSSLNVVPNGYTFADTMGRWGFSTVHYPDSTVSIGGGLSVDGGAIFGGHLTFAGNGVQWREAQAGALGIQSVSGKITSNSGTVTYDYAADCSNSDFMYGNIQLNRDRALASPIYPSVHWLQAQSGAPNFMLAYRWQRMLRAQDATWDTLNLTRLAKTYYSGTIHQMSYGDSIPPPDSTNISDVLQLKIVRDRANGTGRFGSSTDPTSSAIPVLTVAVHYYADSFGSDTQYSK